MKTALRNSVFAFVTLAGLTMTDGVKANSGIGPKSNIEVRFIGNLQSQPVFQLDLLNEVADEFSITITDVQGNVLYSDKVKGTNITKKFAINTEEVGDNVLRLEIKSKNTGKKESYHINRIQSYTVESTVTKVK